MHLIEIGNASYFEEHLLTRYQDQISDCIKFYMNNVNFTKFMIQLYLRNGNLISLRIKIFRRTSTSGMTLPIPI